MTTSCSSSPIQQIDEIDVFDAICDIRDPELPNTLEELAVVTQDRVVVDQTNRNIQISIKPTVKHCSLVSHISLCIRLRLQKRFSESLQAYKLKILLLAGSHNTEVELNKQINDKERVAAAMENPELMKLIRQCADE
jgi:metal-sulfur cluster biosynthetic enzyme